MDAANKSELKIFVHTCDLDEATTKALKKANVIAVKVTSPDDVKLLTGRDLPVSGGKLLWAALKAFKAETYSNKSEAKFCDLFEKLLAKELEVEGIA